MVMKRALTIFVFLISTIQPVLAGLVITRSSGIALTGADGVQFVGLSGIALTGADGINSYLTNGIALTGADGIALTGANAIAHAGADGVSYTGPNGITLTGADGIALTGADGITLTGADGISLTGADGQNYVADSVIVRRPDGIALTGADGITLTGVDGVSLIGPQGMQQVGLNGITLTGADGITLTGADGITLTGADGITLTGADWITGVSTNGVIFDLTNPTGITLTGADGIAISIADGIALTGADGITLTGVDGILPNNLSALGLQGFDGELALALDRVTDDSTLNAVVVFHKNVTESDLDALRGIGILGGTRFRRLPIIYVSGTKQQIVAISRLPNVRSIFGNRTLQLNVDPYFAKTGVDRVPADNDLRSNNSSLPYTGRNVSVAVLDTGINGLHPDLTNRVRKNVRLVDLQSVPLGFSYPIPVEGLPTTDLVSGHGTFVGGIIAGSGAASNGKFAGVAPGASLVGLSAGDLNLTHILSGFDYILENAEADNIRVVNCSFSSPSAFDVNDPVNIATKLLTESGINVVVSAGNTGPGNGTLNPYAAAPWVVSVGATDRNGILANFSSRGNFGSELQHPTLVAPGVNVAGPRSLASLTSVGGVLGADTSRLNLLELPFYTTASGTSFSAPQVSGAIALMLEADPDLTPAQIKVILSATATPMPKYFLHEVGAGMLNAHAAVLAAAFPERRLGIFRSTLSRNAVKFGTYSSLPSQVTIAPGTTGTFPFPVPAHTLQATFTTAWGFGLNDFGMVVRNPSGSIVGESNYLNLPGLTGRREKVVLQSPNAGTYQSQVRHTANLGTTQAVTGYSEITQVGYPELLDISGLSASSMSNIQSSLVKNLVLPEGRRFKPTHLVPRGEFAAAILRSGSVPQYMYGQSIFTDVQYAADRNAVESVQAAPQGKLIYDAQSGNRFYPHSPTTKLAASIAYVRAAGLESTTSTTFLSLGVIDGLSIPLQWRGHVAVALKQGFITLDGNRFNQSRAITRLELATSLNKIVSR